MNTFPENAMFKYPWRKYQQRVLNDLDEHLSNRHLHVVAPPGSGKTILGLEVARRLNQPTLILAPTIAIRNQWVQRFCQLFLPTDEQPGWISKSIRQPAFLTVCTYQGLHAACINRNYTEPDSEAEEEEPEPEEAGKVSNENFKEIVAGLNLAGVKTIVIDEAHHLKREWWNTLNSVKQQLNPIIVGLTATPPYDVSYAEWERYLELNGSIDAEIAVPELVAENDLCPHQDYVYFSIPSDYEQNKLRQFRERMEAAAQRVRKDNDMLQAFKSHAAYAQPEQNLEWIFDNLACYSAMLIFLNAAGVPVLPLHIEVLGNTAALPKLDDEWLGTAVDFYLYRSGTAFEAYAESRKNLERFLKQEGAIEKRQVNFRISSGLSSDLTSSISKLDAIKDITNAEFAQLGSSLRMVILTDYIRKEFYINGYENVLELNKLGIIPIFEKLRRDNPNQIKLGVLTGSMVILPATAITALYSRLPLAKKDMVTVTPVPYDAGYILVTAGEQAKHDIVSIVTDIFQAGEIEVLIGTKSLLGEGWDAPAINALILASFVGSFVLSNQMRGRAIRAERDNPEKTGNIWHLVCVDTGSVDGGPDFELLKRRFKGFVGLHYNEDNAIQNGIQRLCFPEDISQPGVLANRNNETFELAAGRENLRYRWDMALAKGTQLVEEIKLPYSQEQLPFEQAKKMYFDQTIAYLMCEVLGILSVFAIGYLKSIGKILGRGNIREGLFISLILFLIVICAFIGRKMAKAFYLYTTYRDVTLDIDNIANALLDSLIYAGYINTNRNKLLLSVVTDEAGCIYAYLKEGTTYEKQLFTDALYEILNPIENPKYIISRLSKKRGLSKADYHAVPELLGKKKANAAYFEQQWRSRVGQCDMVYTRTPEGRQYLLMSKSRSLSSHFTAPEQTSKWR